MAECDVCGTGPGKYSYTCNRCGGEHCRDHRLPEHHDCPGLTDPEDGETVVDPDRSSARRRHEVVEAGGVRGTSGDADPGRPWVRYALAALATLLVGVALVALFAGVPV